MIEEKTDFTQGSILKKLFWFMLPVLGALILQAAYGAVDLLVVGRFGTTAGISAVSTGSQLLNLVTFVVTQLAMGITVLIARYLGEKKSEQIGAVLGGAFVVFAIVSLVLFFALVCFAKPLSVLMQAPQESLSLTVSYVRICGSGMFFIVAYNLLSAIFHQKDQFSMEFSVPEISFHWSAVGFTGISDTNFFSCTLCICQSSWACGLFWIRGSQ